MYSEICISVTCCSWCSHSDLAVAVCINHFYKDQRRKQFYCFVRVHDLFQLVERFYVSAHLSPSLLFKKVNDRLKEPFLFDIYIPYLTKVICIINIACPALCVSLGKLNTITCKCNCIYPKSMPYLCQWRRIRNVVCKNKDRI